MYALATTRKAGRYGEEDSDENDVPVQPPSTPRPINIGMETAARDTSHGDLQPGIANSPRRRSAAAQGRIDNATYSHPAAASPNHPNAPDPLTEELREMQAQQQLEVELRRMQLEQKNDMYAGLVPDPGPPPAIIHCLSRSNSIVSDISFKEREWIDDPSMASSKSAQEHMISAEDWEGVILHATLHNRDNSSGGARSGARRRLTPESSRSRERSYDATSGPELADDLTPLVPPIRKATIMPREFTVWNPNAVVPAATCEHVMRHPSEHVEALARKPPATSQPPQRVHDDSNDIQRSPFCSVEETNQTFQQLHPEVVQAVQQELDTAAARRTPSRSSQQQQSEPHLQMEELRIEGLTEEEMIRMAIEQSQREEEERQRLLFACVVEDDIAVEPVTAYSLEKLMKQPRPERTSTHSEQTKAKGMKKVRNMLGLGGRSN